MSAAAWAVHYSCMRSPRPGRRGAERLTLLADPNTAGFYERNGAVRIGEAPSDTVRRPPAAALRGQTLVHG